MEWLTLGLFCGMLLACLALDLSILYALCAGLGLFFLYDLRRGFSLRELGRMALRGVLTVRNVLITFLLIGMLTALWRAAGTIPVIVCYAGALIRPEIFLLMAFLLNCGISLLTGTSFGTSATMGVICMTIAGAMGVSPVLTGGAVLAGAFFGDRSSPVSTSCLLVSEVTGTNIFENLKRFFRVAWAPFGAACVVYALLGLAGSRSGQLPDLWTLFGSGFVLHWVAVLPAAVILLLSCLRVNVKIAMTVSILTAIPICLFVQNISLADTLGFMLGGYRTEVAALSAMVDGGGAVSMLRPGAIVCLSSSYSDIFRKTGLLDRIKASIGALADRTTPYIAALLTSLVANRVACNQTLGILLTHQLCDTLEPDRENMAVLLADSAVVTAPLIPWSIAGAVPLAAIGADAASIPFACYLWLLPLWHCLCSLREKKRA